jgi:hypothetical protein
MPQKQLAFIEALAESGCVDEACRRVGRSRESVYELRRRHEAGPFRLAWDAAQDYSAHRLSDAAFSRAIHGVTIPIFYKGEQVGERKHFDERLTMFLMRYRDPVRYGKWRDTQMFEQHEDGPALILARRLNGLFDAAYGWILNAIDLRRQFRAQKAKQDVSGGDVASTSSTSTGLA